MRLCPMSNLFPCKPLTTTQTFCFIAYVNSQESVSSLPFECCASYQRKERKGHGKPSQVIVGVSRKPKCAAGQNMHKQCEFHAASMEPDPKCVEGTTLMS